MFGYDSLAGSAVISLPAFRETFGRPYDGDYVVDANWQLGFQAATLGGMQRAPLHQYEVLKPG